MGPSLWPWSLRAVPHALPSRHSLSLLATLRDKMVTWLIQKGPPETPGLNVVKPTLCLVLRGRCRFPASTSSTVGDWPHAAYHRGLRKPPSVRCPLRKEPRELRPAGRTSVSQALSESQGRLQRTALGVQRRLYLILGSPVLGRTVCSHVSIQPALSTPPDMRAESSLHEVQQSLVSEGVAGVFMVERLWDPG